MTSNFFKVVLAKSVALSDIDDTNPRIARFVKRAKQCGFQNIVEEDVRGALACIPPFELPNSTLSFHLIGASVIVNLCFLFGHMTDSASTMLAAMVSKQGYLCGLHAAAAAD